LLAPFLLLLCSTSDSEGHVPVHCPPTWWRLVVYLFLGSSVDPRIHEVADGRPSCTPGSQLARPIVPLCPDVADQDTIGLQNTALPRPTAPGPLEPRPFNSRAPGRGTARRRIPDRRGCAVSVVLGGASRGRAVAGCGIAAGEHVRSTWRIRASHPHPTSHIHQSGRRAMPVGSRSGAGPPAPAWPEQIKDQLSGVAPYRHPPATSSWFHGHLRKNGHTCTEPVQLDTIGLQNTALPRPPGPQVHPAAGQGPSAGSRQGNTPGAHRACRSTWLIRASRPIHIHQSCPRTTVCADAMLVDCWLTK
jgi:hypothetical protein